ncbi:uncharacterized protein LOC113212336, partial [Frankliniella occidentalis]|uniref:Uncharacterized protein LOC113212336 n=1 Tax=Frankliniella occidentalis TaxID=133901 RepID=A0A9C6XAH6_FRAOC
MSPVALRALACLVALVAVEAIYLPDAPSSEEQAQVAPSSNAQAHVSTGVPDDYRTLEEEVIRGILDSYDPLVIPELPFNQTLKEITASGLITDLTITGQSGLKVNKLSLQGAKVAAAVTLPSIAAKGQYTMTGVLPVPGLATLPLDGSGQITFGLSNLELDVAIELGISDKGQITLDECELTWNMTTIKFRMDGVLGGSALGNMINNILADALPHLVLKVYHDKITTFAISAAAGFLPTIHQDHGPLPPFEAPAPLREHRVRRAAARAEDIRELLKDGRAEAEAQHAEHSDGPVLLSHLLSALARGGDADADAED